MRIYYCGQEDCAPGHFFGPAMRTHYLMHFVFKGRGQYQVGGRQYKVEAGQVFLIQPQEITYYEADKQDPWSYGWIAFDGEDTERMLGEAGLRPDRLVTDIHKPEECRRYIEEIVGRFRRSHFHEYEMIGYGYLLFSTLVSQERATGGIAEQGYLERATAYIRHNYSYDIQITDIARHVGIDRTYLYKIFMNGLSVSPKQYLIRYRVLAAKEMIANTSYNMTEIALSCGFYDLPSFCNHFKRQEGLTPAGYRMSLAKTYTFSK